MMPTNLIISAVLFAGLTINIHAQTHKKTKNLRAELRDILGDVAVVTHEEKEGTEKKESIPHIHLTDLLDHAASESEESADEEDLKAQLAAQNALGDRFFGMDSRGYPVPDRMEDVLDLEISMMEEDWEFTKENRRLHEYRDFQSAVVRSRSDGTVIASLNSTGRMRPRGQSSSFFSGCLDIDAMPFTVQFDRYDEDQTLFGSGRFYLRMNFADRSYIKEWSLHRMLARFGLPFLRTRTVRLFINGDLVGLYNLMESPHQEYVFARSYPDYDPDNYNLYKFGTEALVLGGGCGAYPSYFVEALRANLDEPIPDFVPEFPPPDSENINEICEGLFFQQIMRNYEGVVRDYIRDDGDCGEMLVEEEYVDRKLGRRRMDSVMKEFLNRDLFCANDDESCNNSDLAADVDVDTFLKSAAFYTTTLGFDSPVGNGNNFYLAQTGDNKGWKMYPWDFDNSLNMQSVNLCSPICADANRFIHWPIVRPTCGALENNILLGPLLSNETLHEKYISYVREFVTTIALNETFIQELEDHAKAIEADARADAYNILESEFNDHDYLSNELSANASNWDSWTPFLPGLMARAKDIMDQLEALEDGTYPRGPFQATDMESWEFCPDWRWEEPHDPEPVDLCYMDCQYDGCFEPDWTMPGNCIPDVGCMHGEFDAGCDGIPDLEAYEGMEPRGTEFTFCNIGLKMSFCPPPNENATGPLPDIAAAIPTLIANATGQP